MKARSAKQKGTRLEEKTKKLFLEAGCDARRQPGSGIYSDFPHDVYVNIPDFGPLVIECKKRKDSFRQLDKWRGQADMLVLEVDYGQPMVYMPLLIFTDMLRSLSDAAEDD